MQTSIRSQEKAKRRQKTEKRLALLLRHGAALCRKLKRVKGGLPKKEAHIRVIVKASFENTLKLTLKKQKLLTKRAKVETKLPVGWKNTPTDAMKVMIDEFLCRIDISYTLPDRNNQLYMG